MTEGSDPTADLETPAPTVAFPPSRPETWRPSIVALTFLAVAAAGFLIGIAAASAFDETPPGIVVASSRAGPAGATVRFDGGEIRVPSGALAAPVRIVVRRTIVGERVRVRPPGRPVQVYEPGQLTAYVFEPTNVDFLRPVTLLFRIQERFGDATSFARVDDATLLLGGVVDADRRTVAVEVTNFRFNRGQPIGADA